MLKNVTIQEATRGVYDRGAIVSNDLSLVEIEAFARDSGESDLIRQDRHGALAGLVALGDVSEREELGPLGASCSPTTW